MSFLVDVSMSFLRRMISHPEKTNSYKRTNGGTPHIDKNTGKQLEAKNIVVMFAKESPANDGYEGNVHLLYGTEGIGEMIVFQDGKKLGLGFYELPERLLFLRFVRRGCQPLGLLDPALWLSH